MTTTEKPFDFETGDSLDNLFEGKQPNRPSLPVGSEMAEKDLREQKAALEIERAELYSLPHNLLRERRITQINDLLASIGRLTLIASKVE